MSWVAFSQLPWLKLMDQRLSDHFIEVHWPGVKKEHGVSSAGPAEGWMGPSTLIMYIYIYYYFFDN